MILQLILEFKKVLENIIQYVLKKLKKVINTLYSHRYPPTNILEQMYTSQRNQRHGVEQDQIQTPEPYEKNDQKYSNEKRRYKKKNMTKKEAASNKHSVAGIRNLSPLCPSSIS